MRWNAKSAKHLVSLKLCLERMQQQFNDENEELQHSHHHHYVVRVLDALVD